MYYTFRNHKIHLILMSLNTVTSYIAIKYSCILFVYVLVCLSQMKISHDLNSQLCAYITLIDVRRNFCSSQPSVWEQNVLAPHHHLDQVGYNMTSGLLVTDQSGLASYSATVGFNSKCIYYKHLAS